MLDLLDRDVVRLRWLSMEAVHESDLRSWRETLDRDELERADRFRFARERDAFLAAHALTRSMLSEATGLPADRFRYVTGRFGKLALVDAESHGHLNFNLSHTRGFVSCALALRPIGVDVETSDPHVDLAIVDRFFAPEEARAVRGAALECATATFFRLWTLKEAFIKATGEGFDRPLASFSFELDPVRISFHPERDYRSRRDGPENWRFVELRPDPRLHLAAAVASRGLGSLLLVDARPSVPAEICRDVSTSAHSG